MSEYEKPGLPGHVSEEEIYQRDEVHPLQNGLQTGGGELADQVAGITARNDKVCGHQDSFKLFRWNQQIPHFLEIQTKPLIGI